jgi:DNA-binding MarR family transcriptional regulator
MAKRKAAPLDAEALEALRHANVGRLLLDAFRYFTSRTVVHLHRHGFPDLRPVHTTLLRHVDARGTRITELSARANITKQGVGQLVADCERLGYVTRSPDPRDSRARIVRFTKKGERFLAALPKVLADAGADIERVLGEEQLHELEATLQRLLAGAKAKRD